MNAFLEKIKLALRYRNDMFDTEISGLTEACKADLTRLGVKKELLNADDPTIVHIVTCYVKWQLNFQGEGEKWGHLYRELRQDITLDRDYRDGN